MCWAKADNLFVIVCKYSIMRERRIMELNLQEACQRLRLSESTLREAFPRTVRTLEKQGIKLTKVGRGQNADYTIEYVNKE